MSRPALIFGFLASILSLVVQAFVWRHLTAYGRTFTAIYATSVLFSVTTISLIVVNYFFPTGKDYERLARERAEREANKDEKERFLRLRKQEDDLRRQEAETRTTQTEALLLQQRYEEEQARIERNTRARNRRRQARGLPPETRAQVNRAPEPKGEPAPHASALDAILSDDDDSV